MLRLLTVFIAISGIVWSPLADANGGKRSDVCARIKTESLPTAYLIDANGNASPGPVDFGKYGYAYQRRDYLYIPTTYRLVITPRRIKVVGSADAGYLNLEETKPICANSRTYRVSYAVRGFPLIRPEKLPWKEDNDRAGLPDLEDPNEPLFRSEDLVFRFDRRVVGEIYDANLDAKK